MELINTAIPDVKLIRPKRFGDHRGFFAETYNKRVFAELGINLDFVQDNHSRSAEVGTIRGLHYQLPPYAQDKLVRVVKGAVWDVAVDIRKGSPTFGRHVAVRLDAQEGVSLLVPKGFAHGFITLEPDTEVIYKVTDYYAPSHDRGLMWNDPDLGIDWPIPADRVILSDRDRKHPPFADLVNAL
ncbi:MAG TPA: dTDP-4-dehydrorhamnose 3,5-epimerase [Azospirillaceae bacterium]|nr:dTDP-4-dehydrorhamnose 3,5-epimerase [Azospirillaceae bacterium]